MMHYTILDSHRLSLLSKLSFLKSDFYLAGGTGLALHVGHRESIDFDFFTVDEFDTEKLFKSLEDVFGLSTLTKIQEEKNTLTVIDSFGVKISFFSYPYPLIEDCVNEQDLKIASVIDIGAMKLNAITSRATNKDYVDLYYILKSISLSTLIEATEKKFPNINIELVLKSLVYFDDIILEPLIFKTGFELDFDDVKTFLIQETKKMLAEGKYI